MVVSRCEGRDGLAYGYSLEAVAEESGEHSCACFRHVEFGLGSGCQAVHLPDDRAVECVGRADRLLVGVADGLPGESLHVLQFVVQLESYAAHGIERDRRVAHLGRCADLSSMCVRGVVSLVVEGDVLPCTRRCGPVGWSYRAP